MSPTTKAHRLVLKAGRLGGQKLQTPLISAIFAASMEEGKDIADSEVLADLASECGVLSREETTAFIDSDELKKEVEEMSAAARAKGITGVPIIIIDGKWAVSGGQSSDVYVQVGRSVSTPSAVEPDYGVVLRYSRNSRRAKVLIVQRPPLYLQGSLTLRFELSFLSPTFLFPSQLDFTPDACFIIQFHFPLFIHFFLVLYIPCATLIQHRHLLLYSGTLDHRRTSRYDFIGSNSSPKYPSPGTQS
jgi:hypothetical protein